MFLWCLFVFVWACVACVCCSMLCLVKQLFLVSTGAQVKCQPVDTNKLYVIPLHLGPLAASICNM
jgi:hypothetical protein